MALSADTDLIFEHGERTTVPVKASAQIYLGAAVGFTSGYARGLVAGDDFAGFALENKLGTTDGAVNCAVSTSGQVKLSISSIAVTDIGKPVYASADGTFTLTQSTNSKIGTVSRWVSTGVAIVRYAAQGAGSDLSGLTSLTDSTGGSANNTLAAITLPTALTDNGGGTADGTVASAAAPVTLTDSTGDSGTHDDTLAAVTETVAITDNSGGVDPGDNTIASITNANNAGSADVVPTAAAVAQLAAKLNVTTTAIGVLKQNSSDTAQKIIELVTLATTAQDNLKEVTTELAATRTALNVTRDCLADLAAKVNEIIAASK